MWIRNEGGEVAVVAVKYILRNWHGEEPNPMEIERCNSWEHVLLLICFIGLLKICIR